MPVKYFISFSLFPSAKQTTCVIFFYMQRTQADLKQMQALAEQYDNDFFHAIDRFTVRRACL
jgi:7-cyano-7-deazaguanine synthase in queuosine biosynthesis